MSITNATKQEREASTKFSAHSHFKLIQHIFKNPLKFLNGLSMTFLASLLKTDTLVMEITAHNFFYDLLGKIIYFLMKHSLTQLKYLFAALTSSLSPQLLLGQAY